MAVLSLTTACGSDGRTTAGPSEPDAAKSTGGAGAANGSGGVGASESGGAASGAAGSTTTGGASSSGGGEGAGGASSGGSAPTGGASNGGSNSASTGGSAAGGFANAGGATASGGAPGSGGGPSGNGGAPGSGGSGTGGLNGAAGADADGGVNDGGNAEGGNVSGGSGGGGCDPGADPHSTPCLVDEAFGVFVSPTGSDTTGLGTRASPYLTPTHALSVAHGAGKLVFACGGQYSDSLDIGATLDGSKVYGGFACATWAYTAEPTILTTKQHGVAHRVHDVTQGIVLDGLELRALDGVAPGESSIALLVANASGVTHLVNVRLVARNGARGSDGAPGQNGSKFLLPGETAALGGDGGACSGSAAGTGGTRACTGGATSSGGAGGPIPSDAPFCDSEGISNLYFAGSGSPGSPYGAPGGVPVADYVCSGGIGGGFYASSFECGDGADGVAGTDGALGTGATGTGLLDGSGWTGVSGSDGAPGAIGGGAGGGSAGYFCTSTFDSAGFHVTCVPQGGGGGGGGAGGCGATGGRGGGAGGSSIALVVVDAPVDLESTALVAGNGGNGGNGGDGAVGEPGQSGAPGGADPNTCDPQQACAGGLGGRGGHGAPGGGGVGGHSLGIAYVGTAPSPAPSSVTLGLAGSAGKCGAAPAGYSGTGDPRLCDGVPGRVATTWSTWTTSSSDVDPPVGAAVTAITSKSCRTLDVSWSAATDGPQGTPAASLDYELCWSTVKADCDGAPNFTAKSTFRAQTSATISGLTAGTTEYVAVRAKDAAGNVSAVTAVLAGKVSTTADLENPAAPSALSAQGVANDGTAVTVSWSAGTDDCTAAPALTYEVCSGSQCPGAGPWTATAAGATAATVTGLPACGLTPIYVRAKDASGKVSTATSTSGRPTSTTVCFGLDVQPILASCSASTCHSSYYGSSPHPPPTDYAGLMAGSVRANNAFCENLVEASDPASSFVYAVTQSAGVCGRQQMTTDSASADKLYRWISQGAQNN
jgi:hypothetical protein